MIHSDCQTNISNVEIIYPTSKSRIKLPKNSKNLTEGFVSIAASSNPSDTLFWFLDKGYKTFTTEDHKIIVNEIDVGDHYLTVISTSGTQVSRKFRIVND